MAVDFSAFDEQVDLNALQKEVQEADDSQFEDVPDGDYDVFPATLHRSGLTAWQSNLFAHGLINLKQIQYRNLSTTVILLIAYLIFFRKYRVKLVQQLPIRLMTSIQLLSMKHSICKNF